MGRRIPHSATEQSTTIIVLDGDGLPYNSLTAASAGLSLWYWRRGAAKVAITPVDLEADDDPHADGGLLLVGDGVYRLDLPDAARAAGADEVKIGGTATGYSILGQSHPLGKTTATIAAGDIATDAIDADSIKADAVTKLQAGLSTLNAAGVRSAVGMASANLDTQLTTLVLTASDYNDIVDALATELAAISAIKTKTDLITSGKISIVGPTTSSGELIVYNGDDYLSLRGNELTFENPGDWSDLTDGVPHLLTRDKNTGDIVLDEVGMVDGDPTEADSVTFELLNTDTSALENYVDKAYDYKVRVEWSDGSRVTLFSGDECTALW